MISIHIAMGGSLGQIDAEPPHLPGGSIGYWQVVGTYVKSPLSGPWSQVRGSRKSKVVEVFDIKNVEDHRSSGDRHVFGKHLFVIDLTVTIYTPRSHLYVWWNFFFDKQMCHLGWQRLL